MQFMTRWARKVLKVPNISSAWRLLPIRAMLRPSSAYFDGSGIPESAVEAEKWLLLAVEQGHAEAQVRLNEMYAPGEDIEKDYPDPKPIEGGGSGLQSKSPDTHDSKAVDDDLKIHLKELKTLHEEGIIDDDEYKSLKGRALGL
mgnify:CR=1 FL=1